MPRDFHLAPVLGSPLQLLPSGTEAFARLVAHVRAARREITIRAFVWHDDDTGNTLAKELLAAAERGVKVRLYKDRVGASYEYSGRTRQSFFHKRIDRTQRMQALFLNTVYPNLGSLEQRPNPLAAALASHANVELHCERSTFDHAKVFVFDRHTVVLGSMGIGDNHRDEWLDVMVECHGPEFIDRLTKRSFGAARFDRDRGLDYLLFCRSHVEGAPCDLLLQRLALIEGARRRIAIEMAYLGDRRFTDALADAVGRGVDVTLLTSKADVIGDLNLATCNELLRRTRPRSNLRIAIHPRVVHSKVMVIDGRLCDIGSANFTPLSHGVYDEVDLFADDSALAGDLEQMIERHCEQAKIAAKRVPFRRIYCYVERAIVGYQARGVR